MTTTPFVTFAEKAKRAADLTPELEALLQDIAPQMLPQMGHACSLFFEHIALLPETVSFLIDEEEQAVKCAYYQWLRGLFTTPLDAIFIQTFYEVTQHLVKTYLPFDYVIGVMTLMNNEFMRITLELFIDTLPYCSKVIQAINALSTFILIIIQQVYYELSPVDNSTHLLIDFPHADIKLSAAINLSQ